MAAGDRALVAAILTPGQAAAFQQLPAADQRHAVRVTRRLLGQGVTDPDLVVAALLHDLGKVDPTGAGRVRLIHRVVKVLLQRCCPARWVRLSQPVAGGFRRGYYLLQEHPALGAAWAARLGVPARACLFIAAHQAEPTTVVLDPAGLRGLRALQVADDQL